MEERKPRVSGGRTCPTAGGLTIPGFGEEVRKRKKRFHGGRKKIECEKNTAREKGINSTFS